MPYSEDLAERIRQLLSARDDVEEKKMFGGLTFMVAGKMCCGVRADDLMVRVGPDFHDQAIESPHARRMDITGKPMRGFVFVSAEGLVEGEQLSSWVDRGIEYASSLSQ